MTLGLSLAWLGSGILAINNGLLPSALGILTILIYAALYTPIKPIRNLYTLIGAFVGAIPPLIGWTAASQSIDLPGILLSGILFFWQLPHFLALSWLYREDYKDTDANITFIYNYFLVVIITPGQ